MAVESATLLYDPKNSQLKTKHGIWTFIKRRSGLLYAIISGLVFVGTSIAFTLYLSGKRMTCPDWAVKCSIQPPAAWVKNHLPLVQGIVSTIHGIGLALLAYPSFIFAEAALWPVLMKKAYPLKAVDMYLAATRGSVPSLLQALFNAGTGRATMIMLCVVVVATLLQVDRIVVGQAYSMGNATRTYGIKYKSGAEIGLTFPKRPLGPIPVPASSAKSLYTSWANNLALEPLPEIRDWIVDRMSLSVVGNFSISGLKAVRDIECTGKALEYGKISSGDMVFPVFTNFPTSNATVRVRLQRRLTAWVENVDYKNSTRTVSTLIFACVDCPIENSTWTPFPDLKASAPFNGTSALECTVDITLQQAIMNVGIRGPTNNRVNVSSTGTLRGPSKHSSPFGSLGDVAEWLGTVVTTYGDNVYSAQPLWAAHSLFSNGSQIENLLPIVYTTEQLPPLGMGTDSWTQDDLKHFVAVGSGALALAMSRQGNKPIILSSTVYREEMLPSRSLLLLIPALLVVAVDLILAGLLAFLYSKAGIQEIRQARTSEMIYSTQNWSIATGVKEFGDRSDGPEELDELLVQYDVVDGGYSQLGLRCVRKD